ncbi:unnamed protein product [Allacma fusca]|uniref:SPRY domain-containing protein 7 n=1 Tax=Allacma fusca TaxID=39272 RepID=A0A8J2NSG0_9HEXA|nr:unnamed protein product [Allacma fusca]
MWCCSNSAKFLFESIVGLGGNSDVVTVNQDGGQTGSMDGKKKSDISIDSAYIGHEVVVVKNGMRICGSGGALGIAPLIQTKSYFEVKLQQEGKWGLGLATRNASLDNGPTGNDLDSWILRYTGELYHNGQTIGKIEPVPQEGDIMGVSFDHIELNFYTNGVKGNISFANVRGTVYPALYVDDGAVLDVVFDGFAFPPPIGFDRIMKEKSIL